MKLDCSRLKMNELHQRRTGNDAGMQYNQPTFFGLDASHSDNLYKKQLV